ncbi:hypothetical protein TNCV_3795371 [Trichonephila clavipes]|nr:hypothetical protein TNCV_3795371 [Trichonephila clavipes]
MKIPTLVNSYNIHMVGVDHHMTGWLVGIPLKYVGKMVVTSSYKFTVLDCGKCLENKYEVINSKEFRRAVTAEREVDRESRLYILVQKKTSIKMVLIIFLLKRDKQLRCQRAGYKGKIKA